MSSNRVSFFELGSKEFHSGLMPPGYLAGASGRPHESKATLVVLGHEFRATESQETDKSCGMMLCECKPSQKPNSKKDTKSKDFELIV